MASATRSGSTRTTSSGVRDPPVGGEPDAFPRVVLSGHRQLSRQLPNGVGPPVAMCCTQRGTGTRTVEAAQDQAPRMARWAGDGADDGLSRVPAADLDQRAGAGEVALAAASHHEALDAGDLGPGAKPPVRERLIRRLGAQRPGAGQLVLGEQPFQRKFRRPDGRRSGRLPPLCATGSRRTRGQAGRRIGGRTHQVRKPVLDEVASPLLQQHWTRCRGAGRQ